MAVQSYTKIICVLAVLLIGGSGLAHAAEKAPLDIDTHIARIEKEHKAASKAGDIPVWLESKMHFLLARAYGVKGDTAAVLTHIKAMPAVRDRRILIRPYMDRLRTALAAEDDSAAFALISVAQHYMDAANKVPFQYRLFDPEFGTVVGEALPVVWVQQTLCKIAADHWAQAGNTAALEKLAKHSACIHDKTLVPSYAGAYHIRQGDVRAGYDVMRQAGVDTHVIARTLALCSTPENRAGTAVYMAGLTDEAPATRLVFLVALSAFDRAYDLVQKNTDVVKDAGARAALITLYEALFRAGEKDKVEKLVKQADLAADTAAKTGQTGFANASQWWNIPVDMGRVLPENPDAFAWALAQSIQNDRARFVVLKNIYLAVEDAKATGFPACALPAKTCAMTALADIAKAETDEASQDIMYGMLSELARLSGQGDVQKDYLSRIKDHKRMVCHYDMCTAGTLLRQDTRQNIQARQAKREAERNNPAASNNSFVKIMQQTMQPFYVPDFEPAPAPVKHPALYTALQAMNTNLNDTLWRYRLTSTQSGYATEHFAKGGDQQQRCLLDLSKEE